MSRALGGACVQAPGCVGSGFSPGLGRPRWAWWRLAMGTSRAADKGEAGCPLKKLFPAGVGVGAGAGWRWDLGCRAGQSLENTPFSDPGAGLFSP